MTSYYKHEFQLREYVYSTAKETFGTIVDMYWYKNEPRYLIRDDNGKEHYADLPQLRQVKRTALPNLGDGDE